MWMKLRSINWRVEIVESNNNWLKSTVEPLRVITWSFNDTVSKHFKHETVIKDSTWNRFKVKVERMWSVIHSVERASNSNWW